MVVIPSFFYKGLNKKFNLKWRDIVKVTIEKPTLSSESKAGEKDGN